MSLPTRPDRKLPVSADAIARLIEETHARTLGENKLGHVHRRGSGTVMFRRPTGLLPAARLLSRTAAPFDIFVSGTTVTFSAGTINGYLPTNYLSGVTTVASGTRYLVLNLTASNGQITAATFSADVAQPGAILPYKGQPPVSFKILVGVTIDGVPFKIWGNGNIQADAVESFRIDKASPSAGLMPYDIYYTWSLRVL